jgi:penicillin-insensitive murein DD-endopeptidase
MTKRSERWMGGLAAACLLACVATTAARAQATAEAETAYRRAELAHLPADAAQRLFGLERMPVPGPADAIGTYTHGCLAGAAQLPADGPHWEVMRPSRDRAWGHPALIAFIERLAARAARIADWPGLLVGDIAQPRGGPMLTGHESHDLGLEADIWLTPMPPHRLSRAERDEMPALDLVRPDGRDVDRATWRPADRQLLELAAKSPGVDRIFVNAAIKRALCREAGADRAWLHRIRPWWGHRRHFHLRLACPAGDIECRDPVPPPPPGDGCDRQLAWWFAPARLRPLPPSPIKPPIPLRSLPANCAALVRNLR